MKKTGSILEFTKERKAEIMQSFRSIAKKSNVISVVEISKSIAKLPASRFWVSEERACAVVSAIDRHVPVLDSMRTSKRRMFEEIHRRVAAVRRAHPEITLVDAVATVIYDPAPEHYMEPKSITELIYLELAKRAG